ncbi:MAG: TetR family transcriptional regulator C-terminal domain-containing protein, partial [Deltaproteobacteria bacterium]|nr:TetR family transcriptional regulator C-terminal domain-containing protein [Deltaproteobacteria bacterium]
AIERMFDSIIRRTSDPRFPRGCLNTNTSLECPGAGDEITRKIAEGFGRQESAIYRVLRRAQAEGLLRSTIDARALARFFMAVAQGLNVVNKAVADPSVLQDIARVAMTVWGTTDRNGRQKSRTRKRSQSPKR